MGVLLQPDDRVEDNSIWSSPLAGYAAQYWVTHARFKSVSSSLRKAMEYLFDSDRPHFATWLELHNVDIDPALRSKDSSSLSRLAASSPFNASPLYYAALCGFQDLVEHLVIKHPQHVNIDSGCYGTPLVAALAGRHFQTAKFLHDNGAHLDVHYDEEDTPLHSAAWYGDVEMVQTLLGYDIDVNARRGRGWTPLHDAAENDSRYQRIHSVVQSSPDVARILLEHGANVGAKDEEGRTPLHGATRKGSFELVHMLLEHGADAYARPNDGSTPLLLAAKYENIEVVRALLGHGANVGTED